MFVHAMTSGLVLFGASIVPGPLPPAAPILAARILAASPILAAPPIRAAPAVLAPSAPASIQLNEANAIRTLRQIAAAERMFRDACDIDTNCDRDGEFGYFAELAGGQPMRVSVGCQPAAGSASDVLSPPLLPSPFAHLSGAPDWHGFVVPYKGYEFQIWLAGPTVGGLVSAVREDPTGGKAAPPFPDSVNGARYWICYAWPIDYGHSGVRAFCVNQRGFVLECPNTGGAVLDGLVGVPWFDEALSHVGDLRSPLRIGVPGGALSTIWNLVP